MIRSGWGHVRWVRGRWLGAAPNGEVLFVRNSTIQCARAAIALPWCDASPMN